MPPVIICIWYDILSARIAVSGGDGEPGITLYTDTGCIKQEIQL